MTTEENPHKLNDVPIDADLDVFRHKSALSAAWEAGCVCGSTYGSHSRDAEVAELEDRNDNQAASIAELAAALKMAVDALVIKLGKPQYEETLEFHSKIEPIILGILAKHT